ncbi:MAG TPA: trypsin-like peptidase domain-containing protein [Candidatus Sulfomarinibacteraceae bacterium]|nr:trypsin-like peptidase domain-containing protein [Candidatus Sulfomarinibacteraceae bacterium]
MRKYFPHLLLIFALFLSACAREETPPPTADAEAIAATVLAQVQAQQTANAEPTTTATPTPLPPTPTITPSPTPALTQASVAGAADIQEALVDIYRRANPSVVFVITPPLGSGSGFLLDDEGHIVTNNHVVEGLQSGSAYEIVFANGQQTTARLVGTDIDSDLAVLKADELPQDVEPLPLAVGDSVEVGQFVVAIGNPFGEQGSMSLGIVSGLGRSLPSQRGLDSNSTYSLPEVIQTDAPINPGNSGGPLLNLEGEVIGVNSAIVSLTGVNSGVGYAIPVQAVQRIAPSLIADGSYTYPYIGASFASMLSREQLETFSLPQTQGAYVLEVLPDSPAAAAGLVGANPETGAGGDLIIAIDDRVIASFADLNSYLVFNASVGQTIELTVLRDGEEATLSLTLDARP